MENELKISSRAVILNILLISMLSGVFPMMATPAMAVEQAATPEKNRPEIFPTRRSLSISNHPPGLP